MIALPLVALLVGFFIVYPLSPGIAPALGDYVAIAVVAGFDALVGALRSRLEHRFDEAVFLSGFFANMVLAASLAYFGSISRSWSPWASASSPTSGAYAPCS
jgi:small basic protein